MLYKGSIGYEKENYKRTNRKILQEQRKVRLNKQQLLQEAVELDLSDIELE